ncbi:leucine-rich repeat-containing protein 15 [Dendroctonus ponderosae]|uniref:Toll-like receptor 4 n=1 Tax=Dendroctonus ponderosae TaxID=77166 RepID=U4U4Y8_DENPD|nr:leucine-rich repeat-containing protein 15 [Dendroctonus ponderosae]ERL88949.1 hypothetical protein D910_06327 [Dendroctonus ponderosae]KAH1028794.1 hypothetical protein HUJ05_002126 [Dendroctonus ponderosae]
MLKACLLVVLIGCTVGSHVRKMVSEVTVLDANLLENTPLRVPGLKKEHKGLVEHLVLMNCSGSIDEVTFWQFPKLNKLTIWRSRIEHISSFLPITELVVVGSYLPNLDFSLQEKLHKLRVLLLMGNKKLQVEPLILKNFKHLQALFISEANFTDDCVTKNWFNGMEDLQELALSDNGIHCMTADAFSNLQNLRKLDLTYNHLSNIYETAFKRLTKLEQLGFFENDLEEFDFKSLASQMGHLELLGVSWKVLKSSGISAENLLKVLPNLKLLSFGHTDMPSDFKAGEFCQILKQNGVSCAIDSVFGISTILGYQ